MSDEQALYLTLLALYLLECTAWVPRGSAAFVSKSALKGRLRFPRRGISNNRGGLVLGPLLPGSGAVFVVPQWPLSLGPEGVLSWVAESLEIEERAHQSGLFVAAPGPSSKEGFKVRVDGRDVLLQNELLVTAVAPELALKLGGLIEKYFGAAPKKRASILSEWLSHFTDMEAAKRRAGEFFEATKKLRFWSFWVAMTAFVFAPGLSILYGFVNIWPILLVLLYLPTWGSAFLYYRAHKKLFPQGTRLSRIGHTLLIALLPINAMRACDSLAKNALLGFHPLAVAAFLASEEQRKAFAAHLIRDLHEPRRPVCLNEEEKAEQAEKSFRELLRSGIIALAQSMGLSEAAALQAPAREEGIQSYCPRCLAQFGEGVKECGDCGGIGVRVFVDGAIEHGEKSAS